MIGEAPGQSEKANALPVQVQRKLERAEVAINRKLTRKEQGVLAVLMNPEHADKSIIEKCKLAGCGTNSWYRVLRDPWIKQKQIELTQEFVANHIAPILEASRKTAVMPGRDGWQDRRWLAEYGGFYIPRKHIEQHVTGTVAIGIVGVNAEDI